MGRWLELWLLTATMAAAWLILCAVAAAGMHLYRRLDVMLSYGYSWKDAGVQLRAVRRRKDGWQMPVSRRTRFEEPPAAGQERIPYTPRPAGDWASEHKTAIVHEENAPWQRLAEPPAAAGEQTMTLIRPVDDAG